MIFRISEPPRQADRRRVEAAGDLADTIPVPTAPNPSIPPVCQPRVLAGALLFCLLSTAAGSSTLSGPEPPQKARDPSFASFEIVFKRNIFDPDRQADFGAQPVAAAPKTESLSLLGTMLYGAKQIAFFGSTLIEYQGAKRRGETIAGFQIVSVGPGRIKLARDKKTIELEVGSAMNRQAGGPWQLALATPPAAMVQPPARKPSPPSSTQDQASFEASNDILKKLMERRKKELNQ